ncbi:hypothetical protein ACEPPN_003442 [Leptodophora sp. 'Broadleaf-Isolate-01']
MDEVSPITIQYHSALLNDAINLISVQREYFFFLASVLTLMDRLDANCVDFVRPSLSLFGCSTHPSDVLDRMPTSRTNPGRSAACLSFSLMSPLLALACSEVAVLFSFACDVLGLDEAITRLSFPDKDIMCSMFYYNATLAHDDDVVRVLNCTETVGYHDSSRASEPKQIE